MIVVGSAADPAWPAAPLLEPEPADECVQARTVRGVEVESLQSSVPGQPEQFGQQSTADPGPGVRRVDQDQLQVTGVCGTTPAGAQQRRADEPVRPVGRHGDDPAGADLVHQGGSAGSHLGADDRRGEPDQATRLDRPLPQGDEGDPERVVRWHTAAGTRPVDPEHRFVVVIYGVVIYGVVIYGVVIYGVVIYGVISCDVVSCDVICGGM